MAYQYPKHSKDDSYDYSFINNYYQLSLKEHLDVNCEVPEKAREQHAAPQRHVDHVNSVLRNAEHPPRETSTKPDFYIHHKKKLLEKYDHDVQLPSNALQHHQQQQQQQQQQQHQQQQHQPCDAGNPSQTTLEQLRQSQGTPPELIPIDSVPAVLEPPSAPGHLHSGFHFYPSRGAGTPFFHPSPVQSRLDNPAPRQMPPEKEPCVDKPQDLRVSSNKRLKDVAMDLVTASSIPQLHFGEIPKIVSSHHSPSFEDEVRLREDSHSRRHNGAMDRRYKRMSSNSVPHRTSLHGQPNGLPTTPACPDNSYPGRNQVPSACDLNSQLILPDTPPEFQTKPEDWPDTDPYRPCYERQGDTYRPHNYGNDSSIVGDQEAYKRKPIRDWFYSDVIFFLMEACIELRISANRVKYKSSDNGLALLRMGPADFEVLAPNNGQKLYDYFINFKTSYCMATNQLPYHYNGGSYDSHTSSGYPPQNSPPAPNPHQPHGDPYDPRDPHPDVPEHPSPFLDSAYHSSPSSFATDSPSTEYVPQGSQYVAPRSPHLEPPAHRKSYPLPSAAGKTFAPLHDDVPSDQEEFEDEPLPVVPKKRKPGRPPKPESERKRKTKKTGRLWEFIRNLLLDPKTCPSLLKWENPQTGVFRIVQSEAIANKWGMRKNNTKMNYEKLSRAMRYYYKAKIFEPVLGKRLVYKFGCNAKGWEPLNINNPNFETQV